MKSLTIRCMFPFLLRVAIVLAVITTSGTAWAQGFFFPSRGTFEVTITNLTRDQRFTPIMVVTHAQNVRLFELASPASAELEILAEQGDVTPLMGALLAAGGVLDTAVSSGLLDPGATVTLQLQGGNAGMNYFSVASMLIPTNDAFLAVNGASLPLALRTSTFDSPAYDAGTEQNDETCASIPGPFFVECGGPGSGGAPAGLEEGYVHIHAGVHGGGDLDPAARDWRNPVARITIRRVF